MLMKNKHFFCWSAIIVLDAIFMYFVMAQGMHDLYRENSWAENLQALLLIIAFIIFSISAYQHSGRERIFSAFLGMICFAFFFREIDFDRIAGMPSFIVFMLAGQGRGFFFAIILCLMALIVKDYKHYFTHIKAYLCNPVVIYLCVLAPAMLVFSHVFDRKIWMLEYRVFYEELAEMTAYCFMLCSAIFSVETLHKLKQDTA